MHLKPKVVAQKDVKDCVMGKLLLLSIGSQWAVRFDECNETFYAHYSDENEARRVYNSITDEDDAGIIVELDSPSE